MSEDQEHRKKAAKAEARQERLAAALRANLRRRKARPSAGEGGRAQTAGDTKKPD